MKQDVERQTEELYKKYSVTHDIIKKFSYYLSGLKNTEKNIEILNYAVENKVENIIVSEISRISRKVIDVLQFVEKCNKHKINVIIDNYKMHTLNSDKTENSMVQTMLHIGASFAQMELRLTQQRLNSGRKRYIEKGGVLGRKKGSKEKKADFLVKHKDVSKLLNQNLSIRHIMKITEKSSGTVQKVKKLLSNNLA